jgi:hypothetical protein
MLYVFFWVISRRLNFICRRFGTLFHFYRQVGAVILHLPAYEDGTEFSETSADKIQMPGELPRRKHTTCRTRRKFEIKVFRGFPQLPVEHLQQRIASSSTPSPLNQQAATLSNITVATEGVISCFRRSVAEICCLVELRSVVW